MYSSFYRPFFSRGCRSSTDRHPRLHTHTGPDLHNKGRGIYVKKVVNPQVTTKVSTLPKIYLQATVIWGTMLSTIALRARVITAPARFVAKHLGVNTGGRVAIFPAGCTTGPAVQPHCSLDAGYENKAEDYRECLHWPIKCQLKLKVRPA